MRTQYCFNMKISKISSNQSSITSSNQPSITSSNKEKNVKNIMNFGNMDFKKTSGCGCGK